VGGLLGLLLLDLLLLGLLLPPLPLALLLVPPPPPPLSVPLLPLLPPWLALSAPPSRVGVLPSPLLPAASSAARSTFTLQAASGSPGEGGMPGGAGGSW